MTRFARPAADRQTDMKILIHAGMHKTGTTSIQKTFSALAREQEIYSYAPGPEPSHNVLFVLGFVDEHELEDYYLFRYQGIRLPRLLQIKKERLARLDAAVAANTRPLFLFSCEALRGHFASGARRFADYCRAKTDDVEVLIYVRPPASFAVSMFQEALKVAPDARYLELIHVAQYRRRFEPVLACFGRSRVRFKLYDRGRLKGGDAALDFAAEIGVPLAAGQVIRRNESLRLETVALLHAFKSQLPPRRPTPYRLWQNDKFVAALCALGKTKLRFTPKLMARVVESQRDDIRWMERKLGAGFDEDLDGKADSQADCNGAPIGTMDELLSIADKQTEAVEELAGVAAPAGASRRRRLLYALTALHDRDNRAVGASPPTFYTGLR